MFFSYFTTNRMGLTVLLDAFTAEAIKLRSAYEANGPTPPLDPLIQVVKAICHTLASVESNSIASAIQVWIWYYMLFTD